MNATVQLQQNYDDDINFILQQLKSTPLWATWVLQFQKQPKQLICQNPDELPTIADKLDLQSIGTSLKLHG